MTTLLAAMISLSSCINLTLSLVHVRVVFLFVAFIHLAVTAAVTLSIDTTVDEDPRVRAYYYTRWKLITCWFNLITLAYLPARLYCEWKTSQGTRSSMVALLHQATDVVYTAILFPVVVYSDIFFWIVFTSNPALLGPPRIFVYLPYWAQHSLHTVSLLVVLLDLVLTPRKKPKTTKPRGALLLAFTFAYMFVLISNYARGEMVYEGFNSINSLQLTVLFSVSLAVLLLLFSVQWVAIEFIWGRKSVKKIA